MEKEQWKYKIGSGIMPVILSAIMLAIFGGVAIWMYTSENGAFLFGAMLAAVMLAVFLATGYRFAFYKVLMGRDGFYYQTRPGNGKYHEYARIRRAWISSGKNLSGVHNDYCNCETPDGKVIRFPFYYADTAAVKYLIKRVEVMAGFGTENDESRHEYRIDAKQYGKAYIVISAVLAAIVAVITLPAMRYGGVFYVPGLAGIVLTVFVLGSTVTHYFCYRIQIGTEGFYYQTTPFNGHFYRYSDILSCTELLRVYRRRRSTTRLHYYSFIFTDKSGKTRRFRFEKPLHEREVNVLKERIEMAMR